LLLFWGEQWGHTFIFSVSVLPSFFDDFESENHDALLHMASISDILKKGIRFGAVRRVNLKQIDAAARGISTARAALDVAIRATYVGRASSIAASDSTWRRIVAVST